MVTTTIEMISNKMFRSNEYRNNNLNELRKRKDLDDIAKLYNDGIRIFKLKTGFAEHHFDVMRLEKLRKLFT